MEKSAFYMDKHTDKMVKYFVENGWTEEEIAAQSVLLSPESGHKILQKSKEEFRDKRGIRIIPDFGGAVLIGAFGVNKDLGRSDCELLEPYMRIDNLGFKLDGKVHY